MAKSPDALKALQDARKTAMAHAAAVESEKPPELDEELDEAECFVRLVIEMYARGLRLGMGVLPDGMAVFIRLTVPKDRADPYAGLVSFVVSDDTLGVLRKAVQALQAKPQPPYWKPDQFAR